MSANLLDDDLLNLLGQLYLELQIGRLLQISFETFIADHERHLSTATLLYIGGGLCIHQGRTTAVQPH